LKNKSVGGHDVGETQVPNRVEDSSGEEGHVLYQRARRKRNKINN
jgi:hypothetical protein